MSLPMCVLLGGPDHVIAVNGENIRFEDHPQLGPCPINKRGGERTMGPRHKFWHAVTQWYQQGKVVGADGRCVWAEDPDPLEGAVHIAGNQWVMKDSPLLERFPACPGCKKCERRRTPTSEGEPTT